MGTQLQIRNYIPPSNSDFFRSPINTVSNTSSGSQDQDGTGSSQPEPHRAGFRAYLSQNTPPERLPEASRSSGVTADQVPNSLLHVSLSDLGAGLREERLNSRPRQTEEPEACAAPITMDQAQSTQIVVSLPHTHIAGGRLPVRLPKPLHRCFSNHPRLQSLSAIDGMLL